MDQVNDSIKILDGFIYNEFISEPNTQQIAAEMLQHFKDFKPMLPLIYDLRIPAMQKRHWDELSNNTGITVPVNGQISLHESLEQAIKNVK